MSIKAQLKQLIFISVSPWSELGSRVGVEFGGHNSMGSCSRDDGVMLFAKVLQRGLPTVRESDVFVWPPVLIGERDVTSLENFPREYLHIDASSLNKYINEELERVAERSTAVGMVNRAPLFSVTKEAPHCRPLFVISSATVEGYLAARHIDHMWSEKKNVDVLIKMFSSAGWSLSYATVRDMDAIDPQRKLVDWTPLCSSAERNGLQGFSFLEENCAEMNKSDAPQCPPRRPLFYSEDLKTRVRDINEAELESLGQEGHGEDTDGIPYWLRVKTMLRQEFVKPVEAFLEKACQRELELSDLFTFDGTHVAKASAKRLDSLGLMINEEPTVKTFTSRMIDRGVELELSTLQSVAEEIRRADTDQRMLKYLHTKHRNATQKLIEKQKVEMLENLSISSADFRQFLEAGMESRLKLVKSVRHTGEKVSTLTTFLTGGIPEIVEQVHMDALQDQAKSNQECCICYQELQGFSVASGQGESSSARKVHRRACFLPCMHANVCFQCSDKRWNEGPRLCPICRQKLTMKPRVIYL